MSTGSTKAPPGGGGSKQHDYYGSIAGVICQGRLDFIWGLMLDGKLVWPTTLIVDANQPWPSVTFPAGKIIAYNGRVWEANTDTTEAPPHADWDLFRRHRTGNPNPYKFTVENWGDVYLYWGTDNQTLDATNEKFLNTNGHPAYRHRPVLALKDFLFGTERQSAPNAVVLGGRTPAQTLITGEAAELDADWQANPWCVIAELLTHPVIGLGLPDSLLDATSWQAQADWCRARSAQSYISPIYDRQQQVRNIVADLLQYVDGFTFWTRNRTIAAGHWPHGEEPPAFTEANTIDIHDLVEPINWKAESWRDTANATVVNYNDINYAFNNVPAQAANLANRAATRRVQSRSLDRPFIVRAVQAAAVAAEDAKLNGEPKFSGELNVRAEKAASLGVGDIFRLTDDSQQISRACRCTGRTLAAPPAGTVKLAYETERGLAELAYAATPLNPTPGSPPPPARIANFELVQVPPQLSVMDADYQFVCLAGRNSGLTSRLGVWWRNEDADSFEKLVEQTGFAVFGTVSAGLNHQDVTDEEITDSSLLGTTYTLASRDVWNVTLYDASNTYTAVEGTDYTVDPVAGTITLIDNTNISDGDILQASYATQVSIALAAETPVQDIERISTSLTDDETANNTLLLFLFKNDDPRTFEILSVKSVAVAGSGDRILTVKRALYGTKEGGDGEYEFTSDDRAFLIFRSGLTFFTHESFAGVAAAEGDATFRLTPGTAWMEAPVVDVYDAMTNATGLTTETSYSFLDPYPPVVTWTGIFANTGTDGAFEAVADLDAAVFGLNTRFRLVVQVTDRNGDLQTLSLNYYRGGGTAVLVSQVNLALTGAVSRTYEFTLAEIGSYRFVLSAHDQTGRVTGQFLTNVGGTGEKFILVQVPSPLKVLPPTVTPFNAKLVTLSCATSGAVIYYQVLSPGIAPGGAWITYLGGHIPFSTVKGKVLYAYASKSGLTDSDVISYT